MSSSHYTSNPKRCVPECSPHKSQSLLILHCWTLVIISAKSSKTVLIFCGKQHRAVKVLGFCQISLLFLREHHNFSLLFRCSSSYICCQDTTIYPVFPPAKPFSVFCFELPLFTNWIPFLALRTLVCLSFHMSSPNEEALGPFNLFKQCWESVYYPVLKFEHEDKHHSHSSVSVIPEDYSPEVAVVL